MVRDAAAIAELEKRIAAARENIIELTEQAAAYSGAADEDLAAARLAEQAEELARLTKARDELSDE